MTVYCSDDVWCPEVPGLVCGRSRHSDCLARVLDEIEDERRRIGVQR